MASADDVVVVELPAPPLWKKKCVQNPKKGGTPRKDKIIFTAPTGEEITSSRQLEKHLKSHPGGPALSEFHWGTSDTPRRSIRLGETAKTSPTNEPPAKKARKSSALKEKEASEKTESVEGDNKQEAEKSLGEALEKEASEKTESVEEVKDPQDTVMQENQDEKLTDDKAQDGTLEEGEKNAIELDAGKEDTKEPQVEAANADQISGKEEEDKDWDEMPVDDKTQNSPPEDGDKHGMELDIGKEDTVEPQVNVEAADTTATATDPISGKEGKEDTTGEEDKQVADGEIPKHEVAAGGFTNEVPSKLTNNELSKNLGDEAVQNGDHGNVDEPKP